MERVRENEVNTGEEVAKVFNRIIDRLNENDEYNESVERHNAGLIEKGK